MKRMSVLVAMVALALMLTSSAHANMIVNGGFEDPVIAPNSYATFPAITGWTALNNQGVEVQNNWPGAGASHGGSQHVELDANGNGGIYQNISTTNGVIYSFSFWYSPRPGQPASTNIIISDVYNTSPSSLLLTDTITGNGIGLSGTIWEQHNYQFSAIGSLTQVVFSASGTSDTVGGFLDDVNVSPVPIPGALLLFGSGLLGLVGIGRKRFKK